MFNVSNAQAALDKQVETESDEFALRFDGLSDRQQLVFLRKANELLDDPDSVTAFNSGTFAQDSSGQPAKQLGGGTSPSPSDLQEALDVIMNAPGASAGQKAAMTRIFFKGPDHIAVETDGTPTELKNARIERDKAQRELAEAQDEDHTGSLAHQLKEEKAKKSATPAGSFDESKVRTALNDAKKAVDDQKVSGTFKTQVDGKDEVKSRIDGIAKAIGIKPNP